MYLIIIKKQKKTGTGQSWFPKSWKRDKMKRAGQLVARQSVKKDGYVLTGYYDKVKIGIKRTNGKIGTIFR
ncbi:MAG: EndoU domain-containing protein [Bacilli bacterium]